MWILTCSNFRISASLGPAISATVWALSCPKNFTAISPAYNNFKKNLLSWSISNVYIEQTSKRWCSYLSIPSSSTSLGHSYHQWGWWWPWGNTPLPGHTLLMTPIHGPVAPWPQFHWNHFVTNSWFFFSTLSNWLSNLTSMPFNISNQFQPLHIQMFFLTFGLLCRPFLSHIHLEGVVICVEYILCILLEHLAT